MAASFVSPKHCEEESLGALAKEDEAQLHMRDTHLAHATLEGRDVAADSNSERRRDGRIRDNSRLHPTAERLNEWSSWPPQKPHPRTWKHLTRVVS